MNAEKAGVIDVLMKKIIVDVSVIRKNGKPILKLFSEQFLIGKILNRLVRIIVLFIDISPLTGVFERIKNSLSTSDRPYFQQAIDACQIKVVAKGLKLSNIKKTGPAVFYANHPLCGADVFVILSEIEKVRPDIKVVVATFLENFPGLTEHCFVINNLIGDESARDYNSDKIPKINQHIADGGALLVFPAGALSSWIGNDKRYAKDPEWKKGFIKFAEAHPETDFYPIFVEGQPSQTHLKLRSRCRHLANAYVFKDLCNQVGTTATIHIGDPIPLTALQNQDYPAQIAYLRERLYALGAEYINAC